MPRGAIGKARKGINPAAPSAAPKMPAAKPPVALGPANLLGRAPRMGTGTANLIGPMGGRQRGRKGGMDSGTAY